MHTTWEHPSTSPAPIDRTGKAGLSVEVWTLRRTLRGETGVWTDERSDRTPSKGTLRTGIASRNKDATNGASFFLSFFSTSEGLQPSSDSTGVWTPSLKKNARETEAVQRGHGQWVRPPICRCPPSTLKPLRPSRVLSITRWDLEVRKSSISL